MTDISLIFIVHESAIHSMVVELRRSGVGVSNISDPSPKQIALELGQVGQPRSRHESPSSWYGERERTVRLENLFFCIYLATLSFNIFLDM